MSKILTKRIHLALLGRDATGYVLFCILTHVAVTVDILKGWLFACEGMQVYPCNNAGQNFYGTLSSWE